MSALALGNPHLNVALAHVVGADETDVRRRPLRSPHPPHRRETSGRARASEEAVPTPCARPRRAPARAQVPLNAADDAGSWVTFSPPGSPKPLHTPTEDEGEAGRVEDVTDEVARRLDALKALGEREEELGEEEEGFGDLADFLDEL